MKLYLVTAESHIGYYGTRQVCLGIFDSKETAEKVSENYYKVVKDYWRHAYEVGGRKITDEVLEEYVYKINDPDDEPYLKISEVDLNKEYPVKIYEEYKGIYEDDLVGGIYIGSYIE